MQGKSKAGDWADRNFKLATDRLGELGSCISLQITQCLL